MLYKNIKHIIWDWNGTLFNDVVLCKDIMNTILKRFNLPLLTLESYRSVFTFPVEDYYRKAGLDLNKVSFEVLGKDFMDLYEARKFECSLFPGVIIGLESLTNSGISHSLLSAYHHITLVDIIEHYRISGFFDNVNGLDNIYAGGKFEIGKKLITNLKFSRDEIILIGDTMHDKDVADELGINSIIIADGHQDFERLQKLETTVFDSFITLINSFDLK